MERTGRDPAATGVAAPSQPYRRNPLGKTLRVLNRMVAALPGRAGVREMAQDLGMAPSTVHRVLRQLEAEGLVRADPDDGRYALGLEFLRLARQAATRFPIPTLALPAMRELVDRCNETALLGLYDPSRMELPLSRGVIGPAGMPKEIVDIYSNLFKKISVDKEFVDKSAAVNLTTDFMDPAGFAQHWNELDVQVKAVLDEFKATQKTK